MRGQVPPGDSMPAWASRLMALRARAAGVDAPAPIADGDRRSARGRHGARRRRHQHARGLRSRWPTASSSAAVFHELLGFNAGRRRSAIVADAQARARRADAASRRVRPSIVPHAPYSVSPALFRRDRRARQTAARSACTWRVAGGDRVPARRHAARGASCSSSSARGTPRWQPPACGPVEYLERLGLLTDRLLAVHGVQLDGRGARRGWPRPARRVVTCPRSNRWTGAGTPPVDAVLRVRRARGDRHRQPGERRGPEPVRRAGGGAPRSRPTCPAARMLESATRRRRRGARLRRRSSARSSRASAPTCIAVRIPAGVEDVEEYLVSGVPRRRDRRAG